MTLPLAILSIAACLGCNRAPGRPAPNSAVVPPDQIMDFQTLYGQNCSGCHGAEGRGGAALALRDPVFLAIADERVIRRVASQGVPGTPMPAFAQSAGGMLTGQQIEVIVRGIRSWAKPEELRALSPPPYSDPAAGNPQRGEAAYANFCASCHGSEGRGGKASSIVDGAYLSLVSDQDLRTIVIAGRPELGAPDWRNDVPGQPMSAQNVSDVVAWLAQKRPGRWVQTANVITAQPAGGTP